MNEFAIISVPSIADRFELVLIFVAVIIGVVSASYLYDSADIFVNLLRKPLRYIASGMFVIAIGVLFAAVISYEAKVGIQVAFSGLPLQAIFYSLYAIGSLLIFSGAHQFTSRPK